MFRMPTGTFELEPLDSFVITETDYRPKRRISLQEWLDETYDSVLDWPDLNGDHSVGTIHIDCAKPKDVDITYEVMGKSYEIIWRT